MARKETCDNCHGPIRRSNWNALKLLRYCGQTACQSVARAQRRRREQKARARA